MREELEALENAVGELRAIHEELEDVVDERDMYRKALKEISELEHPALSKSIAKWALLRR